MRAYGATHAGGGAGSATGSAWVLRDVNACSSARRSHAARPRARIAFTSSLSISTCANLSNGRLDELGGYVRVNPIEQRPSRVRHRDSTYLEDSAVAPLPSLSAIRDAYSER